MCGACGVIGGGTDWIDGVDTADGTGRQGRPTRLAERHRRLQLVNRLLRSSGSQALDTGYFVLLRGPTGKTEVVDSLAHLWVAVGRVGLAPVDPLDERVIARLSELS